MPTDVTLTAIIGAASYNLSDGSLTWRIDEDGLGMTPVRRITERGPFQHGETDVGFRLEPRVIQLALGIYPGYGGTEADYYDLRDQLLRIFRPSQVPIQLRYDLPNGVSRQIDCYFSGAMSFGSSDRTGYYQKIGIQLRAPDPTFYDPIANALTYNIGASSSSGGGGPVTGFVVPLVFPFSVGASSSGSSSGSIVTEQTRTIAYSGTWRTYPFLRIRGPFTNAVIVNEATGDKLDFTGTTIPSGGYYDIDCRYGYKTVVDHTGANKIATLTADSDLATFSLEADPEAPAGDNTISVSGTGLTELSEVYMTWTSRFVGI